MRTPEPFYDWPLFQFALRRHSLYILGAGASLPTLGGDLSARIRSLIWDNGIYEGHQELYPSPLKRRILRYNEKFDNKACVNGTISQNELDAHTPSALVEILLARQLTTATALHPPQYQIFDHLPASVLFNYNNDNLSDSVDPRHLCLRPHGTVYAPLVHSPVTSEAIRRLAIPQSWVHALDYHRPIPEPNGITSRAPYQTLIRRFDAVMAVVFVGYSFGTQPNDTIDDTESFELIADLLRWRAKPILVIGPDPEPVASRIEGALRRKRVSLLRCRWNVLAEFVLSGSFGRGTPLTGRGDSNAITQLYYGFEEKQHYIDVQRNCLSTDAIDTYTTLDSACGRWADNGWSTALSHT
jgi:hypothetical protein